MLDDVKSYINIQSPAQHNMVTLSAQITNNILLTVC